MPLSQTLRPCRLQSSLRRRLHWDQFEAEGSRCRSAGQAGSLMNWMVYSGSFGMTLEDPRVGWGGAAVPAGEDVGAEV